MKKTGLLAATAVLALANPAFAAVSKIVALTESDPPQLFSFNSDAPGTRTGHVAVSGLQSAETLRAMDFGPVDDKLYALGSTGRLYTIADTGVATQVGSGTFTLSAIDYGMDFGSVIQVVGADDSSNFTLSSVDATKTAGTSLSYAAADPHFGTTPQVEALASLTGTLYGIDRNTDALVT